MGKVTIGSGSDIIDNVIRVEEIRELSPSPIAEQIIENLYDDSELRLKISILEDEIDFLQEKKNCVCSPEKIIEQRSPDNTYVDIKYEELNNLIEGIENVLNDKIDKKECNPNLVSRIELDQKLDNIRTFIEDIRAVKPDTKIVEVIKEDQKLKKINFALIALNVILIIVNLL
jgi:hypothetical protein